MSGFLIATNSLTEIKTQILLLLVSATIAAAVLALVVLMVNFLIRRWLTAGQMALLWGLVLLRLVIPFGFMPESSFSLQNILLAPAQVSTPVGPTANATANLQSSVDKSTQSDAPQAVVHTSDTKTVRGTTPEYSLTGTALNSLKSMLKYCLQVLPLIWLTGSIIILGYTLIAHWRFTNKLNRLTVSTDRRLLKLWNTCCRHVNVQRQVPVFVFDKISQPSVSGVFRPKLLLPVDVIDLSDYQLRLIMLHELAHLTRRDLWVNWMLFGLRLIHWWNPIYWLASTRFYSLREQSRDTMVLRWLENKRLSDSCCDARVEYSELLLILAQRPVAESHWRVTLPVSLLGFVSFSLRKRSLANRIRALRTATHRFHPLHRIGMIAVMIVVAVSGFSDAKGPPAQPKMQILKRKTHSQSQGFTVGRQPPAWRVEPVSLCVYDVSETIDNIARKRKVPETQARQSFLSLANYQLDVLYRTYQPQKGQPGGLERKDQPVGKLPPEVAAKIDQKHQLSVIAPESFHQELRSILSAWEESGLGQVSLSVVAIRSSEDILGLSGIDLASLEESVGGKQEIDADNRIESLRQKLRLPKGKSQVSMSFKTGVLNERQRAHLIKLAQDNSNVDIEYGPEVTICNGQRIFFDKLVYHPNQVSLLDGSSTQPKSSTVLLEEGTSVSLRPVLESDQSQLLLKVLVRQCQIAGIKKSSSQALEVSGSSRTSDVSQRRMQFSVNTKDRQSILISLAAAADSQAEPFQYLLIESQILGDPDTRTAPGLERKN